MPSISRSTPMRCAATSKRPGCRRSACRAPRRTGSITCGGRTSAANCPTTAARCSPGGAALGEAPDVVFVVADGLSAFAAAKQALPLLSAVRPKLEGWRIGPVVVARQARVALGDEIGELLGARLVAMLIGERPGLSSPDSLGVYLTYAPKVGCHDAQRNCVSNVRPEGLPYDAAAHKLHYLLTHARRLGLTGVGLKDDSDALLPAARTEAERLAAE
ncbi:ethanolamine ammonia-lyase light chain family protein [Burkholderia humptydooensis]|nr:ethanolamine ammonia-lyase light chain family protein [Burkholderia sp. 2002721687]